MDPIFKLCEMHLQTIPTNMKDKLQHEHLPRTFPRRCHPFTRLWHLPGLSALFKNSICLNISAFFEIFNIFLRTLDKMTDLNQVKEKPDLFVPLKMGNNLSTEA